MAATRSVRKAFQQVNRVNDILLPQFENLKQRKLGRSAYNVYVDYKAVFVDFLKGVKNKPLKTATYFAGVGIVYFIYRSNPDERTYLDLLMNNSVELLQISKTIRNPVTDAYTRDVLQWHYEGRLKRQSFGLFSVMLLDDFSKENDSYEKHCYYTKQRWIYLWKQIIDIGILGHWINLESSMEDFDINIEELADCPHDEPEGNPLIIKSRKVLSVLMLYLEDFVYSIKQSYENLTTSES